MGIPILNAADNEEIAHAVHHHIRTLASPVRHLSLWPLAHTNRAFAEWWLIPHGDHHTQRHARLSFSRAWDAPGMMVAAFGVTRGFGRQTEGLVTPEHIMQPGWFWSRFLSDTLAGAFDLPIQTMMERSGQPAMVQLDMYTLSDEPDPDFGSMPNVPDDRLAFAILEPSLAFTRFTEATEDLAALNVARGLRELVLMIEGLPNAAWIWIEARIGVRVHYGDGTGATPDAWRAAELWDNVCTPWLPWLH